jgi:hypothetical protein
MKSTFTIVFGPNNGKKPSFDIKREKDGVLHITLSAYHPTLDKKISIILRKSVGRSDVRAANEDEVDLFRGYIVPLLFNLFPEEEVRPVHWVLHPYDDDNSRTLFMSDCGLVLNLEISNKGSATSANKKVVPAGIFNIAVLMPSVVSQSKYLLFHLIALHSKSHNTLCLRMEITPKLVGH